MKIERTLIRGIGALLLFGLVSSVSAQSIFLTPTGAVDNVNNGDTVSFNIVMDFSGYPNGTLGGGFDINFDSSALQFGGFTRLVVGDPAFGRDPDVFDGLLESWALGDFNGLPTSALLGNVWFQVLPTMGASTTVSTSPTSGVAGPWVDGTDFVTLIPVVYNQITVARPVDSDDDNVADSDDFCPDTAIPEVVPTVRLKPNRWALIDADTNFDTIVKGKGKGPKRGYTAEDTAGCSCEQIIKAQGLGLGHTYHGCSISAMDDWVELVTP